MSTTDFKPPLWDFKPPLSDLKPVTAKKSGRAIDVKPDLKPVVATKSAPPAPIADVKPVSMSVGKFKPARATKPVPSKKSVAATKPGRVTKSARVTKPTFCHCPPNAPPHDCVIKPIETTETNCILCCEEITDVPIITHFKMAHDITTRFAVERLLNLAPSYKQCIYCNFKTVKAAALNDHIELMHPTRVPPKKSEKERLVWKTLADDIDRRQPHYMPGQLVNAHLARSPWWPAVVRECDQYSSRCYVLFFKEHTTMGSWVHFRFIKEYKSDEDPNENKAITSSMLEKVAMAKSWAEYAKNWTNEQRFDFFVHQIHPEDNQESGDNVGKS